MRQLIAHKATGLNEAITILVLDEPGPGGANHVYEITGAGRRLRVEFQNGPILEAGLNGISHEALLAVVIDRLEGFQSGKFACKDNEDALGMIKGGLTCLLKRTRTRVEQKVEGTSVAHVERPPESPKAEAPKTPPTAKSSTENQNHALAGAEMPRKSPPAAIAEEPKPEKFIWVTQGGDDEHGLFDTIQAAAADARDEATERQQGIPIAVFSCRPALAADRELFEGEDDDEGNLIDTTKLDWFVGKWVPEDIALLQTAVPVMKPAEQAPVVADESAEKQVDAAAAPVEPNAPFGG